MENISVEKLNGCKLMVYVDDIEQWQDCKALKIFERDSLSRVKVVTANDTTLNRLIKFITDIKDINRDGCVYCIER